MADKDSRAVVCSVKLAKLMFYDNVMENIH